MKKFLVVLAVMALLVSSSFAAVTTVTKENSQAGYPGELVPGSLTGAQTFVADLPLMANTALFEYAGAIFGLVALKTDLGTIGLSVSPAPYIYVRDISVNSSSDVLGLQYATAMDAMTLGASLLIGIDTYSYDNKMVADYSVVDDKQADAASYLGLKLGAALKDGIDLSLGVAMASASVSDKDIDSATEVTIGDDKTENSKLAVDAAGRISLGNGLSVVLGLVYAMGTEKETDQTWTTAGVKTGDDIVTTNNSNITVGALIGKDIKATDTLTVKLASGVSFESSQDGQVIDEDKIADTKVYTDTLKNSDMYINIPLNVAIEGKLNETWSINAGTSATLVYSHSELNRTNEDVTMEKEDFKDRNAENWLNISPSLNYAIGVTGKIGDLTLEMEINPAILIAGPYLLSGNTGYGNMAGSLALSYNWK